MIDNLITCPLCSSDACYITSINETKNGYYCIGGGHQTTDLTSDPEFDIDLYEESLPELYKDLKEVDSEGRIWHPITINIENKGTVFANGRSKDDWEWCGIKVRELTEEESKSLANKGIKYKSDTSTMKLFQKDFIEAIDYIGFFE
jgi:hypothetical protein